MPSGLKPFQVGDMLSEVTVEYEPLLSAEVLSDTTLDVLSTSIAQQQVQKQGNRVLYLTGNEKRPVLHYQGEGSGCPLDPVSRNENQSGSTEQPPLGAVLSTPVEKRQMLPQAVDTFESINVKVGCRTVDQRDVSLHPSSIDSLSEEKNSSAMQPVVDPVETVIMPATSEKEQQITWAFKQVKNFEAEIQNLKYDTTTRTMFVTSLDREIEHTRKDYETFLQDRQEDIARVLIKLEEQHNKKSEALKCKLDNLSQLKEAELGELKRNELELSYKETGLARFQAIIGYYNHAGPMVGI